MTLEQELRQQLAYELSGIEGVPELQLEVLDKQDPTVVFEGEPLTPLAAVELNARVLDFCRQSLFRLAREIDELRAAGTQGDDPS